MLDNELFGSVRTARAKAPVISREEKARLNKRRDIHASYVGTALWLVAMTLLVWVGLKKIGPVYAIIFLVGIYAILVVSALLEARTYARKRENDQLESFGSKLWFKSLFLIMELVLVVGFSLVFNELSFDDKTAFFIAFISIVLGLLAAAEFFIVRAVRWLMAAVGY